MADLQQQLIWLGAGSTAEPALDFANFSKVTLIDARAEATQALTRQYSQANNVQVITQAVAASGGGASLQHYNLATFAALSPASGLTQLFPGLKASQSENLTTKSINELLSELALSGNQHTLVLDIPDQALSLLQAMQSQQQLSLFTTIYLQYSNDELYAGMAPFSQLEAFFKQHYFALTQTVNTDPDLPVYCFTLDAAAKDLAKLKQQLKTLTEKLSGAEGQLSQAQQQAASEKQQAEQTKTELTKQLEQAKQQAAADKQQTEQTKAELAKQLEQAKLQHSTEQKQAEEKIQQIHKQATEQKLEFEQKLSALTAQLTQSVSEKETLQQQLSAVKVAAEKTQAELNGRITGMDAELKQALEQRKNAEQQTSSVNEQLKQQTLAAEQQKTALIKENEAVRQQLGQIKAQQTELQAKHNDLAEKHSQLQKHSDHRIGELKTALAAAEQQVATTGQKLKDTQASLAALKLQLQESDRNLQQVAQAKTDITKQLTECNAELSKQRDLLTKKGKFSSNADIDDFIADIEPFFLNKKLTYVDVGAFVGEVLDKIISEKKLTVREAHMYEPNPDSFASMTERLSSLKLPVLELNNCAIGDHEHTVSFRSAGAMTKILTKQEPEDTKAVFSANVKTLDSQFDKFTDLHVHILKIDVEGHEMAVLRGAEKSLTAQRVDLIYIEVGFNIDALQQTYMGEIDSFLQKLGYRVYRIYEQKNEWIEDSPLLRRCNFCYMSSKFAQSNPFQLSLKIKELTTELEKFKKSGSFDSQG